MNAQSNEKVAQSLHFASAKSQLADARISSRAWREVHRIKMIKPDHIGRKKFSGFFSSMVRMRMLGILRVGHRCNNHRKADV